MSRTNEYITHGSAPIQRVGAEPLCQPVNSLEIINQQNQEYRLFAKRFFSDKARVEIVVSQDLGSVY